VTQVCVRAEGEPAPQGSKAAKGRRKNGSTILVESSKKVKPWRAAVQAAAFAAVGAAVLPAIGPERAVNVSGWIVMHRPKSVPMRKRRYPVVYPDMDKVLRSIGDAMTGIVYHDDAQVVEYDVKARYHDDPDVRLLGLEQGMEIVVTTLPGQ
jgi:Holliday junction resolvase RusA-like endonuclease